MNIKKSITVVVPSELVYAFDADHTPIFVLTRERGRIVARPEVEYSSLKPCTSLKHDYRNGYMSGVVDGYEDGYRQGFTDCKHSKDFNPRYRAKHWLVTDENYVEPECCGDCSNCRYYDELFDICSYHI